jgi:hypothetical protein
VDISLTQALAPVLRDLENTAPVVYPTVRDGDWSGIDGQLTGMVSGPDGSGWGVYVMAAQPVPEQIAMAADQVQEWAVEELCSIGRPTNWPPCPEHPHTHPLAPVVRGGAAVWMCPKTEDVVSDIGRLPEPRSRDRAAARSRRAARSGAAVDAQQHGQDPDAGRRG